MNLANEVFRLFINRADCYAVQTSKGYIKIEEPLTREVLEAHLRGEKTIGAYQLSPEDSTVKSIIFDLDPEKLGDPKEAAERIIKVCFEKPDGKHPRIWEHSLLLEASRYPDPSYHVWIFFLVPFPAKAARWLGYRILELAELNPARIEVFPKQNELSRDRPYGNFVKLPLGFHRVEKKWSCFLEPGTFKPLEPDILEEVSGISFSEADTRRILELAAQKKTVQVKLNLPETFKSLPDLEEERAVRFLCKYWKPGYRNHLELSFLVLKELQKKVSVKLYLHCSPFGDINLHKVASYLELQEKRDYLILPPEFTEHRGLPAEYLNTIYNISDVVFSTTSAEGWGLPIVSEVPLTKTPVVVPDIYPFNETLKDRAVFYRTNGFRLSPDSNRFRPYPDYKDLSQKILETLNSKGKSKYIKHAYNFARSCSWSKIIKKWEKIFQKI